MCIYLYIYTYYFKNKNNINTSIFWNKKLFFLFSGWNVPGQIYLHKVWMWWMKRMMMMMKHMAVIDLWVTAGPAPLQPLDRAYLSLLTFDPADLWVTEKINTSTTSHLENSVTWVSACVCVSVCFGPSMTVGLNGIFRSFRRTKSEKTASLKRVWTVELLLEWFGLIL